MKKFVFCFVLLLPSLSFALDESMDLTYLPIGTTISFPVPYAEFAPTTSSIDICGGNAAMHYSPSEKYRYFAELTVVGTLLRGIKSKNDTMNLCGTPDVCYFATENQGLKDIVIKFYSEKTIEGLRKVVEDCGGKLSLPQPEPYSRDAAY